MNAHEYGQTVHEVSEFLGKYFDVLQSQDQALFDEVFNSAGVLYSSDGDELTVRPVVPVYRDIVAGRPSPASLGSPRDDQVVLLDVLSPTAAFAKVRLRLNDSIMVDYLSLLKTDGAWSIVAKIYHREGPAHPVAG